MAAPAGAPQTSAPPQQLSLDPGLGLQGELFLAAVNAVAAPPATGRGGDEPESAPGDGDLAQEARLRPRRRAAAPGPEAEANGEVEGGSGGDGGGDPSDLPRWHHHSLVDPAQLPPMLRHYVELKAAHPERVLLYRLGDFFEFFFEDAILLARLLELTLTGKDAGRAIGRVPMAGIPHHAVERYCNDLLRRGLSVALCDQLETTPAKGALLRRDITRVLTPGHRAGGRHARRPPQQLALRRGGGRGALGPGGGRCEHRRIPRDRAAGWGGPSPGAAAAGGRRGGGAGGTLPRRAGSWGGQPRLVPAGAAAHPAGAHPL
jgi:hypothetical protein